MTAVAVSNLPASSKYSGSHFAQSSGLFQGALPNDSIAFAISVVVVSATIGRKDILL